MNQFGINNMAHKCICWKLCSFFFKKNVFFWSYDHSCVSLVLFSDKRLILDTMWNTVLYHGYGYSPRGGSLAKKTYLVCKIDGVPRPIIKWRWYTCTHRTYFDRLSGKGRTLLHKMTKGYMQIKIFRIIWKKSHLYQKRLLFT